jgi:hypothetical protein
VTTEDQRLALANLHALSLAALRGEGVPAQRAYLEALADVAPDPPDERLDPRDDASLLEGFSEDRSVTRRMGAQVRGVILGAGAHSDTVLRELVALIRALDGAATWSEKTWSARVEPALAATREDLERDVIFMRPVTAPSAEDPLAFARRWGGLRSLELNAFVAAFTRDGTHARAVEASSRGRDGAALRLSIAVANGALSLSRDAAAEDAAVRSLLENVERVERAIVPLLANIVRAGR